ELKQHIHGKTNEKIISYLIDTDFETNKIISLKKEQLYRELVKKEEAGELVDGLREFLDYLKEQNIPITIASASIKENIDFFYSFFNLETWFKKEDIVFDDGTHKNKITMFKKAADHMGVNIKDCIVFEDSISGIKYAKEAGCTQIIGIHKTLSISDAVLTIRDFKDQRIYTLIKEENTI
ncbi:HAD family phosphatase, partial [Breznakia sp. OttesenSCG-928-G09]|nr:HAD family phosphatase [Breznakia sp. OttesenSCG-928-G09]